MSSEDEGIPMPRRHVPQLYKTSRTKNQLNPDFHNPVKLNHYLHDNERKKKTDSSICSYPAMNSTSYLQMQLEKQLANEKNRAKLPDLNDEQIPQISDAKRHEIYRNIADEMSSSVDRRNSNQNQDIERKKVRLVPKQISSEWQEKLAKFQPPPLPHPKEHCVRTEIDFDKYMKNRNVSDRFHDLHFDHFY